MQRNLEDAPSYCCTASRNERVCSPLTGEGAPPLANQGIYPGFGKVTITFRVWGKPVTCEKRLCFISDVGKCGARVSPPPASLPCSLPRHLSQVPRLSSSWRAHASPGSRGPLCLLWWRAGDSAVRERSSPHTFRSDGPVRRSAAEQRLKEGLWGCAGTGHTGPVGGRLCQGQETRSERCLGDGGLRTGPGGAPVSRIS